MKCFLSLKQFLRSAFAFSWNIDTFSDNFLKLGAFVVPVFLFFAESVNKTVTFSFSMATFFYLHALQPRQALLKKALKIESEREEHLIKRGIRLKVGGLLGYRILVVCQLSLVYGATRILPLVCGQDYS